MIFRELTHELVENGVVIRRFADIAEAWIYLMKEKWTLIEPDYSNLQELTVYLKDGIELREMDSEVEG